jgi:fatty-acyl-CoA synthase
MRLSHLDPHRPHHRGAEAAEKAFAGGWFHSGDLGVMYPDGDVRLLGRAENIVISGGENISTVQVEQARSAIHRPPTSP